MAMFKVALVQKEALPNNPEENQKRMVHWIEEAKGKGADLVLFPEMWSNGYAPPFHGAFDNPLHPDFEAERFYRLDAKMHSIWFGAVRRQKLWEMLQAQQLHYTRFRMLDFITETDFMRIIGEHEELFRLIEKKDQKGLEASLKEHLYFSMKRMRHSIEVDYKDYFEEEPAEGRFVI